MQNAILNAIVELGGSIISNDEFYFPHKEFTIFCYEDCPEAGDWVAYPKESDDIDMSLLIIDSDAFNNLSEILKIYFEINDDCKSDI